MVKDCTASGKGGTFLKLRVSPGASDTAFAGLYGESALKLRAAGPPEKGRTNTELTRFLADLLDYILRAARP